MKVEPTPLPGVLRVEPPAFPDARGYLLVGWNAAAYAARGMPGPFVQDNVSYSRRGVLRGLHFQHPGGQSKLVSVLRGAVFDVAVDLRPHSPTYRAWVGEELSAENRRQLYIPSGFAHGFLVLSDDALVSYKVDAPYRPDTERSVRWDDPCIGIAWPDAGTLALSDKDAAAPSLADLDPSLLPPFVP